MTFLETTFCYLFWAIWSHLESQLVFLWLTEEILRRGLAPQVTCFLSYVKFLAAPRTLRWCACLPALWPFPALGEKGQNSCVKCWNLEVLAMNPEISI